MNILFLRGFNNYFNRIVKKYSTLNDYQDNSSSYLNLDNINFNPNDGVATELIVGNENQKENSAPLDWENIGTPDYAVCYEMVNNTAVIKFRWFVLESERTRTGQYRLALKRDVLAEHFDQIKTAPCFVEKGFVNNVDSTLLYNKENMTYNQIKNNEKLLKDETGCGWIIGYVSQDKNTYPESGYYSSNARLDEAEGNILNYDEIPSEMKAIINNDIYFDDGYSLSGTDEVDSTGWADTTTFDKNTGIEFEYENMLLDSRSGNAIGHFKFTNCTFQTYRKQNNYEIHAINYNVPVSGTCYQTRPMSSQWGKVFNINTGSAGDVIYNQTTYNPELTDSWGYLSGLGNVLARINNPYFKNIYFTSIEKNYIETKFLRSTKLFLKDYRYIRRGNRLYRINMVEEVINAPEEEHMDLYATTPQIYQYSTGNIFALNRLFALPFLSSNTYVTKFRSSSNSTRTVTTANLNEDTSSQVTAGTPVMKWRYSKYKKGMIQLVGVEETEVKTRMDSTRQQCYDCNTDIFAIPYSENFIIHDGNSDIIMTKQVALQAAMALGQAGSNVYDIQLLPYYPDRSAVGVDTATQEIGFIYNNSVDLSLFTEHVDFEYILNSSDSKIGIYFWSRTSSDSFNINEPFSLPNKNDPLARKISNETEVYRLVSPNYNGQFEFSLAKSGGSIEYFNVDYTYKPYNPYLHIVPQLTGLYGNKFIELDDARGLICGGDFSMARVTSAWEQYQLNNKNFQEIFDRQMKNMDVNNKIALEQQQFNAIAGTLTGGAAGAVGGAVAGSKGGLGGAIAGAAVGLVGGTALSAIGAEKDRDWLLRQQAEAKSYAIDMYGYQLGNIQALPYSLAKTSAFTKNNKLWPFVEFYNATPTEENILNKKIEYEGMMIMAVSELGNFMQSPFEKTYVKGRLIKLDNINDDFHIADAIYQEVIKGFYVLNGGNYVSTTSNE